MAGHLFLAVPQLEAGQVAAVLAPDPEVRVESFAREALADARKPGRPSGTIGVRPALEVSRRRGLPEVGRLGPGAAPGRSHR